MNQNNDDIQLEQPASESIDTTQTAAQPEPAATPTKEKKPQPSRLQRFFRKALIWLVVFAITFLAGMVTDHYLRYKPLSESMGEAQEALNQANQDISGLQAETDRLNAVIQEANDKITSLESEKKALQDELETATSHLNLLQVLIDVSNSRLALFLDDVEGAKDALVNIQQRLDNLLPRIAEFDANLAQSIPQRLSLIVSGLERDTETAKIDLELFTKDLLEIEAAIFGD